MASYNTWYVEQFSTEFSHSAKYILKNVNLHKSS